MVDVQELYAKLAGKLAEISHLRAASAALEWDTEVMMPEAGSDHRSRIMAYLSGAAHDLSVSTEFADIVCRLKWELGRGLLSDVQEANVRQALKSYERERRLPGELVRETAEVCSASHHVWMQARKDSDFGKFLPNLERIVALKREEARLVGSAGSPYDALLDSFEPGATAASVAAILDPLRAFLEPFVRRIVASPHQADPAAARVAAPRDLQARLCRLAAETIGFDFRAGRLDVSAHPFTSRLHPGDTRITTRYDESDLLEALTGVIHEAGHGIYEQALPAAEFGAAAGDAASMGLHESQSRLWENLVGRGRPFWDFFLPVLRANGLAAGADPDALYRGVNAVRPSLIRVEADEATYNLHICLRFEIERELIEGRLQAAALPGVWNARMKQYLGIDVPDDARGVLQDVHWSAGLFGYFPSYALGNLYSAQLYEAAKRDLPGLEDGFRRGEFAPLRAWLNERVHRRGATLTAQEIVRQATGAAPDAACFISYLETKYGEIYRL